MYRCLRRWSRRETGTSSDDFSTLYPDQSQSERITAGAWAGVGRRLFWHDALEVILNYTVLTEKEQHFG